MYFYNPRLIYRYSKRSPIYLSFFWVKTKWLAFIILILYQSSFSKEEDRGEKINQEEYLEEVKEENSSQEIRQKLKGSYIFWLEGNKRGDKKPFKIKGAGKFHLKTRKSKISLLGKGSQEKGISTLKYCFQLKSSPSSKFIQRILLGNYSINFGQGLLLSYPTYSPLLYRPIESIKKRDEIKEDSSIWYENTNYYGILIKMNFSPLFITPFFSSVKVKATLNEDGTVKRILYFDDDKEEKRRLEENLSGINVTLNLNNTDKLGLNYYTCNFSPRLNPPLTPENLYEFRGNKNSGYSIYTDHSFGNINLFAEFAQNIRRGGRALSFGTTYKKKYFSLAWHLRSFDKDYYSRHAYAFSSQPNKPEKVKNEQGIYFGNKFKLGKNKIFLFIDLVNHPYQPHYYSPSKENEYGILWIRKLNKNLSAEVAEIIKKKETKVKLIEKEERAETNLEEYRTKIRILFKYPKFSSELEFVDSIQKDTKFNSYGEATLYLCNLEYKPYPLLSINKVFAFFNIKKDKRVSTYPYYPKVYLYEREVYGGKMYIYYHSGWRSYLISSYNINNITLIFKGGILCSQFLKSLSYDISTSLSLTF